MKAILILFMLPSIAFAQSYEQQMLDNQQQIIQLQRQQLIIAQQEQADRSYADLVESKRERDSTWSWFASLSKKEQKEIIDDWNKSRPDCPFPCPSRKPKN